MQTFGMRVLSMIVLGLPIWAWPVSVQGADQVQGVSVVDDADDLNAEVERRVKDGRYSEAEPLAIRVLSLRERALGPDHSKVAEALNNLAETYRLLGRYVEAEPLHKRALSIWEKALGEDHLEVATSLANLGLLFTVQSRFDEAEPLYKRSLAIREKALGSEHPDIALSLNALAGLHRAKRQYAQAEALYKRSLQMREKTRGAEHPSVASALNNLGGLYEAQGRYGEAEPLLQRGLAIREKALGPNHHDIAASLKNLARLYRAQRRPGVAVPLCERALVILQKSRGSDHPEVADALLELAYSLEGQVQYDAAQIAFEKSLAIREKAYGSGDRRVAAVIKDLAELHLKQGRYGAAEILFRRNLAILKEAVGPDHSLVVTSLGGLSSALSYQAKYDEAEALLTELIGRLEATRGVSLRVVAAALKNLGWLQLHRGRPDRAEPLFKRGLAIAENAYALDDPEMSPYIEALASVAMDERRFADAEPLLLRVQKITEQALGQDHPDNGYWLNNLAYVYRRTERVRNAEMLSRRDLEIAEKSLGPAHPNVSAPLIGLATVLVQQHKYNDAELFVRRALSIDEASFGPEHPNVAEDLVALAKVLREQGRYSEAEPALQRALAIDVKMLPRDSFEAANDHNELALLAQAQKDWSRAAAHWQLAVEILQRRLARASRLDSRLSNRREPEVNKHYFDNLIKATYRLQSASPEDTRRQAGAMFEVAQWGLASNAGNAVALMAARSTAGGSELGSLVRERQDLVAEWQAKDRLLVAAKGNAPKERDLASEKVLTDRLTAIDARLTDVDAHIAADFPNYSAFANPRPSSIQEVQAELRGDEALVLFVDTPPENPAPEETFIWVVTRNDAQFMRSALGTSALKREVSALRCGLDYAGAWLAKGSRCRDLTGVDYTDADDRAGKPLPFDAGRAHKVYSALLGQAKDLIAGKHLLVVASGALTQLPLHVLVTDAPEVSKPNEIAWLARSHAITVLPAVSSLVSLRRNAKASGARQPYLGIGNPLFDGAGPHDAEKKAAALANAECGALHALEVAGVRGISGRQPPQRDGIADVASLRTAAPLPETAAEVCDVARAAGGDLGDVRLGARSTEAEVKRLDEAGALRDFRIVHFATHGAMAGEVTGAAEPGLLLTPPASGSDRDDGYLSASEIAALKFDAEWVLLSACNTAAGGADGGEALSGVAGAFFYAGARSLLVSHWYVESDATVALVAGTFAEMKERPHNGRAEAMRRSMLALIDEGLPPASWAPFVIVGEGGAVR